MEDDDPAVAVVAGASSDRVERQDIDPFHRVVGDRDQRTDDHRAAPSVRALVMADQVARPFIQDHQAIVGAGPVAVDVHQQTAADGGRRDNHRRVAAQFALRGQYLHVVGQHDRLEIHTGNVLHRGSAVGRVDDDEVAVVGSLDGHVVGRGAESIDCEVADYLFKVEGRVVPLADERTGHRPLGPIGDLVVHRRPQHSQGRTGAVDAHIFDTDETDRAKSVLLDGMAIQIDRNVVTAAEEIQRIATATGIATLDFHTTVEWVTARDVEHIVPVQTAEH